MKKRKKSQREVAVTPSITSAERRVYGFQRASEAAAAFTCSWTRERPTEALTAGSANSGISVPPWASHVERSTVNE